MLGPTPDRCRAGGRWLGAGARCPEAGDGQLAGYPHSLMADVYDVIPEPIKPLLPGVVVVRPTADELFDSLGADLMIHANNCVRSFGDFHLALSGGSTPMPFYKHLMIDPHYRDFPWKRTHLWIVDERQVGFDDERCNFTHIDEIIGQHSDIPREQVHPMLAMAPDADEQYELLLRQTLFFREKGQDRLDFVLLGMGGDGHTASLFPHSPALSGGHRPGPDGVDLPRLVLINNRRGRRVWCLLTTGPM